MIIGICTAVLLTSSSISAGHVDFCSHHCYHAMLLRNIAIAQV